MYADDDLLPIRALQHLLYCDRQCALIYVEQVWAENVYTVLGKLLHERTDKGRTTKRKGRPEVTRDVRVVHRRLGITGKCDVVEFRPSAVGSPPTPFPVEYKRGRPRRNDCDRVQLCAQALCLEEMLGTPVPAGAIFYGVTRRRVDVPFDSALRGTTEAAIARLRAMVDAGRTPAAEYDKRKCGRCSMIGVCMPEAAGVRDTRASRYVARSLAAMADDAVGDASSGSGAVA